MATILLILEFGFCHLRLLRFWNCTEHIFAFCLFSCLRCMLRLIRTASLVRCWLFFSVYASFNALGVPILGSSCKRWGRSNGRWELRRAAADGASCWMGRFGDMNSLVPGTAQLFSWLNVIGAGKSGIVCYFQERWGLGCITFVAWRRCQVRSGAKQRGGFFCGDLVLRACGWMPGREIIRLVAG